MNGIGPINIKALIPNGERSAFGIQDDELSTKEALKILESDCLFLINRAISMIEIPSEDVNIINVLRQVFNTLGKVVNLIGDPKGYMGQPFGRESEYAHRTDRKAILVWMRHIINAVLHDFNVGYFNHEKCIRDLMDIIKTMEKFFMTKADEEI